MMVMMNEQLPIVVVAILNKILTIVVMIMMVLVLVLVLVRVMIMLLILVGLCCFMMLLIQLI